MNMSNPVDNHHDNNDFIFTRAFLFFIWTLGHCFFLDFRELFKMCMEGSDLAGYLLDNNGRGKWQNIIVEIEK